MSIPSTPADEAVVPDKLPDSSAPEAPRDAVPLAATAGDSSEPPPSATPSSPPPRPSGTPASRPPAGAKAAEPDATHRVVEWLLRGDALRRAKAVEPEARARAFRTLALAAQRADAAEVLWSTGHAAEALRLAADALSTAAELPNDPTSLRALGVSAWSIEGVGRATTHARASLPLSNEGARDVTADIYVELRDARQTLDRAHRPGAVGPAAVERQRLGRILAVLGTLAVWVGVLVFLGSRPAVPRITASSEFPGTDFVAQNAFDGDPATEWLMPDGSTGWVESSVDPPQDIHSIRVINGRNRQWGDRAVRGFVVKMFRGDEVIAEHEGSFSRIEAQPDWLEIPVEAQGVSAVRFEVESFHRRGAALAELAWE